MVCALMAFAACTSQRSHPEAPFDGKTVHISTAGIPEDRPVFFSFSEEGTRIDFFILKTGGSVESYFDACVKCYPHGLGYRIDGKRAVCRACEVGYDVRHLKDGLGSCYPIRLNGRLEGETYLIDRDRILEGRGYF